jgi:hypothetical protein
MLKNLRYAFGLPAARPRSLRVGAWAQPRVRSGAAGARPSGAHPRSHRSANAHQIVDGIGEAEHPARGLPPAREADHYCPQPKISLHPFALRLTERVAGMPRWPVARLQQQPPDPRDPR